MLQQETNNESQAKITERDQGSSVDNPKRATARPTTELMLRAFEGLALTRLETGGHVQLHLTPLSAVQQRLLEMLDLPPTIYSRLTPHCSEPLPNLGEL